MAILETETFIRKRAGDLVFYPRLGCQIVRSLPSSYNDAKTPSQLYNREKLKVIARFFAPLNAYLRNINFRTDAFNYIESLNMDCVVGTYPDLYVDLEKVILSDGNLESVEELEAEVIDDECLLTWNYGGSVEDRVVCVCVIDSMSYAFSTFYTACPVGQFNYVIKNFRYEEAFIYVTVIDGGNTSRSTLCRIND